MRVAPSGPTEEAVAAVWCGAQPDERAGEPRAQLLRRGRHLHLWMKAVSRVNAALRLLAAMEVLKAVLADPARTSMRSGRAAAVRAGNRPAASPSLRPDGRRRRRRRWRPPLRLPAPGATGSPSASLRCSASCRPRRRLRLRADRPVAGWAARRARCRLTRAALLAPPSRRLATRPGLPAGGARGGRPGHAAGAGTGQVVARIAYSTPARRWSARCSLRRRAAAARQAAGSLAAARRRRARRRPGAGQRSGRQRGGQRGRQRGGQRRLGDTPMRLPRRPARTPSRDPRLDG